MISGEKRISRPRTSQSARSRIKGPIYQEEDPSNFWEVDLSFRPIDISIFGRNQGFRHNFSSYAEWEKTYGYQLSSGSGSESDDSDLDSDEKKNADNKLQEELLRTTQLVYSYKDGKGMVPKLREPRNLYALAKELGPQQAARWPADIQVLDEKVKHIRYIPPDPELFYKPTGCEKTPMVRGEENGGRLVYMYEPRSTFFVRSRVGGLRSGPQKCNIELQSEEDDTLIFESRFESGNLAKAVQVNSTDYELWLRYDLYTNKHTQWFYFRVSNTRANKTYRFTIVNFMKSDSLYNDGMKPLIYSEKNAQQKKVGWVRGGSDIKYYKNNLSLSGTINRYSTSKSDKSFYSLTWTVKLEHNHDTVYFAHCFPYTYTDLQDYLLDLSNDPVKNKICKQRVLCRTLAGNLVYLLSITSPTQNSEDMKHKKAVVITSRVHPGECNSSWMMKGFLDYLTGNSADAKLLRDTFIFKIVPMLNPDGVIVGNYRCSLAGRDLNRNYKTVLKDSYPSVWHTKNMIRKLLQEREIIVYCDLHGHSRKQNVFIYGCENRHNPEKRLKERVFPLMLNKNAPDKFKFESCKFKVQKSKEGTGRIVMWNMGIMNSYTMEATFCGSTMGKKKGYHFSMADFEALGYHFCDTLLDYCDPDNTKSCNILLEIEERLKREIMVKLQKAASTSMPDINDINLSDYSSEDVESSDGGSDSSVSDGPPVHLQFTASREQNDPHACEKKPILTGHQQAHAKQEKLSSPSGGMKYTLAVKRPKSSEEHATQPIINDEKSEQRARRSDYLEALTNAYLRNGLLTQDQAAPHFRYSGNKVSPTIPFNLEGLCPHHEQTFAAQYMAQQIQNINSGVVAPEVSLTHTPDLRVTDSVVTSMAYSGPFDALVTPQLLLKGGQQAGGSITGCGGD
uniref:Peptidase M14 domain-containing protein n=1 Tax=Magallana gigas TaxID=29159 RepID=A0A8W8MZR7_MAGGI